MIKDQKKKVVIPIMSAKALAAIVDGVTTAMDAAHKSLAQAYKAARKALVADIPSGLGAHAAGYKEYTRRLDYYAEHVFASGLSDASSVKTIRDYLHKQIIAEGFEAPKRELDATEKETKAREADASRKAKARAVAKEKAAIKKAEPSRKFAEGELEELALLHVQDAKEESKEHAAQRKAVASKLEGITGFNVTTFPTECKESKYSNGTLERSQAAFAAFLVTFKEETAE